MKHFILAFVFLGVFAIMAWAAGTQGISRASRVGPATAVANVKIAGTSGKITCVSELDVISNAAYTFRVINGDILQSGTTVYAIALSANSGLVRSWDDPSAVCGGSGNDLYLNVSAGTFNVNYQGFTY